MINLLQMMLRVASAHQNSFGCHSISHARSLSFCSKGLNELSLRRNLPLRDNATALPFCFLRFRFSGDPATPTLLYPRDFIAVRIQSEFLALTLILGPHCPKITGDRSLGGPTLLIGAALMMIWMFANAGILGGQGVIVLGGVDDVAEESMKVTGAAAKGLIACTYLFVASYAPTWGPVSWIYPPELFPLCFRGKGVALATSSNWAFNLSLRASCFREYQVEGVSHFRDLQLGYVHPCALHVP